MRIMVQETQLFIAQYAWLVEPKGRPPASGAACSWQSALKEAEAYALEHPDIEGNDVRNKR